MLLLFPRLFSAVPAKAGTHEVVILFVCLSLASVATTREAA
jgi:hypothetical protein